MHHKKHKPQENSSNQHTWTDLELKQHTATSKRLKQFKQTLKKWNETHQALEQIPNTEQAIIKTYLHKMAAYTSQTRFHKFKENKTIHDQMTKDLDDLDDAYIHFKMFDDSKWQLVLSKDIADQITEHIKGEQNLKTFFTRLALYLQGFIPINNSSFSNQKFLNQVSSSQWGSCKYYLENNKDYSLFISVGYEKLPKIQYQKNTVNYMVYNPFIEILKVFSEEPGKKELDDILKRTQELYKNNPSKNISQQKLEQDIAARQKLQKLNKKIHFFKYQKQSQDQEKNQLVENSHPFIYKPKKCLEEQEYQEYLFSLKSYEQAKQNLDKKEIYQSQQDQILKAQRLAQFEALKQFFSFSSSKNLINIYDQIPNKKYKLTEEEKSIVTFDSNMIVIGRSGTGKTLCALLRLFVIQFFFKTREFLKNNKQVNGKAHLKVSDLQKAIGLKNVFLTASPYLIKEIKKQYQQLIEHIKAILMQKSMQRKKKNQQNQEEDDQDDLQFGEKLFKDQMDYVTLDDLIEQFEEKIQRMNCLHDLNEKDFPGFFSIKKFVQLIDGTLKYPMLYKKQITEKQQKQKQPQIESQQRIVIPVKEKQQKKQSLKSIKEAKQKINKMKTQNDQEQDKNVGWIEEQDDKESVEDQKKGQIKNEKFIQVTYEVFAFEFWPEVPKAYFKVQKELAPANIWAQIYSVIKGSYMSHKSHTKYLSKTQYLKLTKRQISEQYEYKKVVYQIFQFYQNWRQKTHHYDFMDLVNHILSDISVYGYQGPMINYLFVDQVQDLPPATMYLVSKIVTNGVFYCGDSAQTIAKGVNFKFGDIPQMFHGKFQLERINLAAPEKQQLVVNFRSHNEILQLGHSVITLIQKLFPGSIDKLKSQSSSFRGPVPILLTDINEVKLLGILTQEIKKIKNIDPQYLNQYQKHAPDSKIFKLGPQQIILVRNEQQKKNLPYRLKQGVVLTFQDVKGLEYDDVVLVNFFSSSKYVEKWKLLSYLKVQYEQIEVEDYKRRLKSKQDVAGHHLQDDKTIQRTYNWEENTPTPFQNKGKMYYRVPILAYSKDIKGQNIKQFYELLTQLKILYTAITRARKNFIIYEPFIPKQLENLWINLKVIRKITTNQDYDKIKDQIHQYRRIHKNKSFQNQEKAWIKEGFKWYMRKNYEQAIRCFRNINDMKTAKRIQAEMIANEAAAELRRLRNQLKNPENLQKQEFKIKKKMLEASKMQINKKFIKSGQIFEQVQRIKNAGQCYYSGQDYKNALNCFKKVNFLKGCAQCSESLKLFEQAGQFYEKLRKFDKMLQCFEKSKNLKKVQQKLITHLGQFTQSENTCIKYGKIILRFQVQTYLDSNESLSIRWANGNSIKYKNPQISQTKKNISRYFFSESQQNLRKVIEIKVKLQINQKQIDSLIKNSQDYEQNIKQIEEQFKSKRPFKSLKLGQKFFDLKSADKNKSFADACYHEVLKQDDAIVLVQNYRSIKPVIEKILSKKSQINFLTKKFTDQIRHIEKVHGSIKDLDINLKKIKVLYQKHRIQGAKNTQTFDVQVINTNQIIKAQRKQFQNQIQKDFENFKKQQNDEQFQINSVLDQSFNSQYMADSSFCTSEQQFSMNKLNSNNDIKNVIFNFSINRENILKLILNAKDIVQKMKNYIDYPLKPPFSDQHHLIIDAKIQSEIEKSYPQFAQVLKFLRIIQRIGQDHLALFTCQFYQLYDLAKRFIVSKIVKLNKLFGKSKKLQRVPFIEKYRKNQSQQEISSFLNQLKPAYFNTQCFRTLSSKQKIVNYVVESLLIQGHYRNALEYISDRSNQKIHLAYAFMDYKQLYQGLLEKLTKKTTNKFRGIYLFLNQNNNGNEAKLLNQSSIQQIFYFYDRIQQYPFLSEIDWKQSVELTSEQISKISYSVQEKMKMKQNQIFALKFQLQARKKYLNAQLPQQQHDQRQNRQTLLKDTKTLYRQTEQQKNSLDKLVNDLIKQYNNAFDQISNQRKKIKREQLMVEKLQQTLNSLKQFNKFLKPKEIQKYWELKTQFYEINEFVNWSKQWNQNINSNQPYDINPEIKINYNINNKIDKQQDLVYEHSALITKSIKRITQIQKQISLNSQSQKHYSQQVNFLFFKCKELQQKILLIQNLPQTHQSQIQTIRDQIYKIQKQIKTQQKNLDQYQKQQRKTYFNQIQQDQIGKHKKKFKQKIMKQLKSCADIPDIYQNGYFSIFLEFRQQKISKRSETRTFKEKLKSVIENSNKDFSQLSTFGQCQIIMLYLSIICYPQKTDIFDYLAKQRGQQQYKQKQKIWEQVKSYERSINQIYILKDRRQGGYFQGNQQNLIKMYNKHIQNLNQDYDNVGRKKDSFSSTFVKLKNMLTKVLAMTDKIQNQSDLHLVELMLGFFQCKVIRNYPALWFLDSQYVIIRSTSVLVKQVLSKYIRNLFCYYLDDNKEFVIMKFQNAYLTMKDLLHAKHKDFLYTIRFYDDIQFLKQRPRYYMKNIRDFGRKKEDQSGLNLQLLCNYGKQNQVYQNYQIFRRKRLQRNIQYHKQSLLRYYFENGFKTAQTFHFLHYQLKVLDQSYKILLQCQQFSNLMIKDLKNKIQNIKNQFEKWKVFIQQQNEITGKSCDDDEQQQIRQNN